VATKQLKPGDELILHEGTYSQPCRRAIQLNGNVVWNCGVKYRPGQFLVGGNQNSTFVNPGQLNFWPRPKSALIGAADVSFAPPFDFNNMKRRRSTSDVGAYDTQKRASNPGWKIVPGFKSPHTLTDDGKTSKPTPF
jgi:hypothetical protein